MMGYSITYNSGSTTPFGTFKQGTITMGLKPQEYTVSSGFTWYANATTPNDNYLIISDTYSQGWSTQAESKPTIWRSETGTTESFVALVNQLPDVNGVTGFTDSGNAMKYLMDSGKYFVNKDDYLGIVTDGLVLNLDAGWYPSYSGSGTTWKDLKGSNNGTLTNGPTFNSSDGGSIVFDGVDDYIQTSLLFNKDDFTYSAWFKRTGNGGASSDDNLIDSYDGASVEWARLNVYSNRHSFHIDNDRRKVILQGSTVTLNTWYYSVGVWTKNSGNMKIYVNGVLDAETTHPNKTTITAVNPETIGIRADEYYPECFQGNIAVAQIYNRALSANEVLQNYNAQKGRFGL